MAFIRGTLRNDIIRGTRFSDRIFGLRGNDIIYAEGGNNTIYGDDRVETALDGNDTIFGSNSGSDMIYGGGGNDLIDGKGGNNYLNGGSGEDTLIGSKFGSNMLLGGSGSDTLTGGSGVDWFVFEQNHDSLDTITNFTNGIDKIVIDKDILNSSINLTTLSNANHIFKTRTFASGTQFYQLNPNDFLWLDRNGNSQDNGVGGIFDGVSEEIVVVYNNGVGTDPTATDPLELPPIIYYNNGTQYEQLAMLTNGVLPRATDFVLVS